MLLWACMWDSSWDPLGIVQGNNMCAYSYNKRDHLKYPVIYPKLLQQVKDITTSCVQHW